MAEKENQSQKNTKAGIVEALLHGMDTVVSTKTVVGEPTQIGDTIIVPLVDVTFGLGAGSGDNKEKGSSSGAGALGGKMSPSAVLVIKDGITRMVSVHNQDTVTRLVDMIPDLVDKFTTKKDVSDEEAVHTAFPDGKEEEKTSE